MRPSNRVDKIGTSSEHNERAAEPKEKRKRSDSTSCHQCHKSDRGRVVQCNKCKKRYCIPCMTIWYPTIEEASFAESCPVCRSICNCGACLQKVTVEELRHSDLKLSSEENICYSKYIVRVLMPSLKKFVAEQNLEREEEAKIQGLTISELQLPRAELSENMQVHCNNCKSSIWDYHRSCTNCPYKLCIACCTEIRSRLQRGNEQDWIRGVDRDGSSSAASRFEDEVETVSELKLMQNGRIRCPPEFMDGCSCGILELYSTYSCNRVSELVVRAELKAESDKRSCSCPRSYHGSDLGCKKLLKAASRESSGDNYIYCTEAAEPDQNNFQWHLSIGEPIIVGNVHSGGFGLSWEPTVMERAFRVSGKNHHTVNVINCTNWGQEEINIRNFFEGYTRGLFDSRGSPKILMLADWPPSDSFHKTLPCHFAELIRCLPFKQYTHPVAGCLNIAAKLPKMSMSALGPKICVSYGPFGVDQEGHQYYSLNKLCCSVSDRVNILMHTAAITHTPQQLLNMEKLKKRQLEKTKQKGQKGRENKGKSPLSSDRSQVSEIPEGGAIWDIFRRQDVSQLEEYLKKHSEEFGHIFPSNQMVHPVHEQIFYVTMEHKRKLKEEYGIEPWTVVQRLGDAVFVPAGCPHQIRYLKSCINVTSGFISPESVAECNHLLEEYRSSPHDVVKEDHLQVKQMTFLALDQAMKNLKITDLSQDLSGKEKPSVAFMKQEMEKMKLILEKVGHTLPDDKREMLSNEITGFLNKISSMETSHASSSSRPPQQ